MKIQFVGATGEVTGSCYHVTCGSRNILVDCGVYQGTDEDTKNKETLPLPPSEIDAILVTHGHMDHSGRIPWLVKNGFKGPVFATPATAQMSEILWNDSARLMREEAEWKSRKAQRRGLPAFEPLYNEDDVALALKRFKTAKWGERVTPQELSGTDGEVTFSFSNAGHILGSSSITLELSERTPEGMQTQRVVFSGDLGQLRAAIGKPPTFLNNADCVLIESTYGDRLHKDNKQSREEFRAVILEALKDRGKVLIPSFVIDRAQRILYELSLMQIEGLLPEIPIYFDSPMGVRATNLYREYVGTLSDEIKQYASRGIDVFSPMGLKSVTTPEESQKINDIPFCIVIAGSGMCSGGRIVHHLKHGLWNPKNHVIIVGYQAYGTLGRRIVEREPVIKIGGEEVAVRAQVHTIGGFSAHADQDDLIEWASSFDTNPLFFVTHGEQKSSRALSDLLQELGLRALVPARGQEYVLTPNATVRSARPVRPTIATTPTLAAHSRTLATLDEIALLIEQLRRDPNVLNDAEDVMSLVTSSRLLLETASRR